MEIEFSSRVENDSENNGGVGGIARGNKGENGKARSSFYVASSPKKIGKSRRKNGQLMSGEAGSKQDYIQTVQSMVKPELEASSRRNLSPRRQKTQKKYRKPTKEDIQIDFGIAQELSVENQLKSILATVYSDNEPSRKNKELATIHSETESRKSDQDCKPSDNFLHRIQSHPDHQNISQDRLENTQTSSDNCGESIRVSEEDNISDQDFVLVHQGDIELKLKKLMAQTVASVGMTHCIPNLNDRAAGLAITPIS